MATPCRRGNWSGWVASEPKIARFLERLELRAQVRWSHFSLDGRLALGEDPASDPALAVRADQLRSDRHRRRLAGWLERLVREVDLNGSRPSGISAAVPVVGSQVRLARESLLSVSQTLRDAEQVSPRGVAMVEQLLTNADSVIYTISARGALELQVQMALDYLVAPDASARSSASATPVGRPRFTQTA